MRDDDKAQFEDVEGASREGHSADDPTVIDPQFEREEVIAKLREKAGGRLAGDPLPEHARPPHERSVERPGPPPSESRQSSRGPRPPSFDPERGHEPEARSFAAQLREKLAKNQPPPAAPKEPEHAPGPGGPPADDHAWDPTIEAPRPSRDAMAASVRQVMAEDRRARHPDFEQDEDPTDVRARPQSAPVHESLVIGDGDFEAEETQISYSDVPFPTGELVAIDPEASVPELGSIELSNDGILVEEDPLFGQPPYEVVGAGNERKPIRDKIPFDLQRNPNAAAVILGGVSAVLNLFLVYLAVTNWWSPLVVAAASFLFVAPAVVLLGVGISARPGRSRASSALRAALAAVPLAALATGAWATEQVRVQAFEWTASSTNHTLLREAVADRSDAVSARACALLVHEPQYRNWLLGVINARPQIAERCLADVESKAQGILVARLARIWRTRMHEAQDPEQGCFFAERLANLPEPEDDKAEAFFTCAFWAPHEEVKSCCGAIVRQRFGKGPDLVPAYRYIFGEHPTTANINTLLAPVLHRIELSEQARNNHTLLALGDPEVREVAFDLACRLLEEPEAAATAMSHLAATADEQCEGDLAPERSVSTWRRICDLQAREHEASTQDEELCAAVGDYWIGEAAAEASTRVHAALSRHGSQRLEKGIVVGNIKAFQEFETSKNEVGLEQMERRIERMYDVNQKRRARAWLEQYRREIEADGERGQALEGKLNSRSARRAQEMRLNIFRILSENDARLRKH